MLGELRDVREHSALFRLGGRCLLRLGSGQEEGTPRGDDAVRFGLERGVISWWSAGRSLPQPEPLMTTDIVDRNKRSEMMSRIRARDTKPELIVRRIAHRLGFRFRLHRRDLPGSPDIVFPRHRAVIMVHGCFWHRHLGCRYASTPKTRVQFWENKFEDNIVRDRRSESALRDLGWRVLVIWECETKDHEAVAARIVSYLGQVEHSEPRGTR